MKKTIRVNVSHPHDIHVDASMRDVARFLLLRNVEEIYVITDSNVERLHLKYFIESMGKTNIGIHYFVFKAGEEQKNIYTLKNIYDFLVKHKAERGSYLVSFGGGVAGDICGFAASTYMRGTHFVQIPTTLLAMVDASIGGKTAINHEMGKNLIGSFYQPDAIFINIDFLGTLPEREYTSALAEVVKYGVIMDRELFEFLETHKKDVKDRKKDVLADVISMSIRNKVSIVESDERESGMRAILNFGHTFGHALEVATGYNSYLHGEAVSIGEVMASVLSEKMGLIEKRDRERIVGLLGDLGLPICLPKDVSSDEIIEALSLDKKVKSKKVFFVLTKGIGRSTISGEVAGRLVAETIEECREGKFPP